MKLNLKQILLISGSFLLFFFYSSSCAGQKSKSANKKNLPPLIIDTDITMGLPFKDVDDGLAVASIILSGKYDVKGITVTFGNGTLQEARERILDLLSHLNVNIPVYNGAEDKYSLGVTTEAARFITAVAEKYRGRITILSIGPLTDLATAYLLNKKISGYFKEVVIMGGAIFHEGNVPPEMESEFNFWRDPPAAKIVLDNFKNIRLFPLDVCMDTIIDGEEMKNLSQCTSSWCQYLYNNIKDWYDIMSSIFGGFYPYDLIAALYLVDNSFLTDYRTMPVTVLTEEGEYYGKSITTGAINKSLVFFDLNEERFKDEFYRYLKIGKGD